MAGRDLARAVGGLGRGAGPTKLGVIEQLAPGVALAADLHEALLLVVRVEHRKMLLTARKRTTEGLVLAPHLVVAVLGGCHESNIA